MRSKEEILQVLADHESKTKSMNREKRAKEMGWSTERLRGYVEGVSWAYRWVLEMSAVNE